MSEFQDENAKTAFISPLDRLNSLVYLHWSLVLHVNDIDEAVRRLSMGLARLAEAVPYLKGRVSYPDDLDSDRSSLTTRFVVRWSPTHADLHFREHPMASKLPDLETMKREGAPAHFFPTDIISQPLFVDVSSRLPQTVFDATYIPIEGGLVINMCVHHGVMDGRGLATLTEMWAEFTRLDSQGDFGTKTETETKLPDPDEPLTREARLIASSERCSGHAELPMEDLLRRFEKDHAFGHDLMALLSLTAEGPKCATRIFSFSASKLGVLKKQLAKSADLDCTITTNSILCAVIWSAITRIRLSQRSRPPTDVSRFSLAVDGRRRLGAPINEPGPYLGNAVLISSVDVSLDVLESADASVSQFAPVVQAVAQAAAKITTDHISGLLSALDHVKDSSDVGPGWLSPHRINFMASSWAGLPLYECDFGPMFSERSTGGSPGTPVFVRYPYAEYNDGNIVVLPRRRTMTDRDEAIEVYVMLAEDDLDVLAKDVIFRAWLK